MSEPTSVYRYYDKRGVLIYVGITSRGPQRQREHASAAEWWRFVASQHVDHYETRTEAVQNEASLIRKHQPPFNNMHNPGYRRMRAAYLTLFAPAAPIGDPLPPRCGHCSACTEEPEPGEDRYDCEMHDADQAEWYAANGGTCPHCGVSKVLCLWSLGYSEGMVDGYTFDLRNSPAYETGEAPF